MKRVILLSILCFFLAYSLISADGGFIAENVKIVGVVNTTNNEAGKFVVYIEGGTTVCGSDANGTHIIFTLSASNNDTDMFKRTYATALMAMSNGYYVDIYTYSDGNDCFDASFIRITINE